MARMSNFTSTLLYASILGANFIVNADASTFLKANHMQHEAISEASLLAEVEATLGEGTASPRVKQLEAALRPIVQSLPKNEKGYLGHSTVRYALHRLFVLRHGWFIKGLHSAGGHRNSTEGAMVLKEQVPSYLQDLFEERLGGRGFGLHELAVLASTIEHLIHSEAVSQLTEAFAVHQLSPESLLKESEAEEVLETYMTHYILGENISNLTLEDVLETKEMMPEVYKHWPETREFVRAVRHNITQSEGSAQQKTSKEIDFALVARVAERVGEQFGSFQHQECVQMKDALMAKEERGTGRVRLSDFYTPEDTDNWQFEDSVPYLRKLGALDESDPSRPRVVIANYLSAPTNCIASSSFYSVCCKDECEDILGHLEEQLQAPEASTHRIAALVSELSSSTVVAPRQLPQPLLARLGDIASEHGGAVPLHGRLFGQWMHHAFPRECPYPHLSGATTPLTPDEWLEATGQEATITAEEMLLHTNVDGPEQLEQQLDSRHELPWSHEEELLVYRAKPTQVETSAVFFALQNGAIFMAVLSSAYNLVRSFTTSKVSAKSVSVEKMMV